MSVIAFQSKSERARAKVEKEEVECKDKNHQLSFINSKVIHLGRFIRLKQSARWENIKLRNGLVLKIHKARKEAETALQKLQQSSGQSQAAEIENLHEELLDLASNYSDYVLYGEASTLELLNKYWEFKNAAQVLVNKVTKFKFLES